MKKNGSSTEKIIRLDKTEPIGKAVNAVVVTSLQMWVRCMWLDLAAIKRGTAPQYEPLLKNFQIPDSHKVYEIRGEIIKYKKKYGDAQEVEIKATEASDITLSAQQVLDRAKAYYNLHKDWPGDDNF